MRSIEHPGPVHPTRVHCVPATVRAVDVELPRGVTLLQGLADAVRAQGATSAVFSLRDRTLAPMAFVMPALSDSPKHVAYFSERFEAQWRGTHRIRQHHLRPARRRTLAALPRDLDRIGWPPPQRPRARGGIAGRACRCGSMRGCSTAPPSRWQPDAETNFSLLQVSANAARSGGIDALVVRVRPNRGSLPGAGRHLRRAQHSAGPDPRRRRQPDRHRLRRRAHGGAIRHRGLHPSWRHRDPASTARRGPRWTSAWWPIPARSPKGGWRAGRTRCSSLSSW